MIVLLQKTSLVPTEVFLVWATLSQTLENSILTLVNNLSFKISALRDPHRPIGISTDIPWVGHGYFLKPHNILKLYAHPLHHKKHLLLSNKPSSLLSNQGQTNIPTRRVRNTIPSDVPLQKQKLNISMISHLPQNKWLTYRTILLF